MATILRGDDNFDTDPVGLGKVLQTVSSVIGVGGTLHNQAVNTTTTVYTTEPLFTLNVTPQRSDSTMHIDFCFFTGMEHSSNDGTGIRILRDGVVVWEPTGNTTGPYGMNYRPGSFYLQQSIRVTDTPQTTSQVTYTIQYRTYQGNNAYFWGYTNLNSVDAVNTLTITEVAA